MVRDYLTIMARAKWTWFLFALFCLLGLLPYLLSLQTGNYNFAPERFRAEAELLEQQRSSGVFETAPPELLEFIEAESSTYSDILTTDPGTSEYFFEASKLDELRIKEFESGYLDSEKTLLDFSFIISDSLSSLDDAGLYAAANDLPAFYYISYLFSQIPTFLLLLPIVVSCWNVGLLSSSRYMYFRAPVSSLRRYLSAVMAAVLYCVFFYVAAFFVIGAPCALKNGLGNPMYPVAYVQGDQVLESTIGKSLLLSVGAIAMLTILFCVVANLFSRYRTWGVLSLILISLLTIAPTTSFFSGMGEAAVALFYSSPLALLDFTALFGTFSYAIGINEVPMIVESSSIWVWSLALVVSCFIFGCVSAGVCERGFGR